MSTTNGQKLPGIKSLSGAFRALADETRLQMLALLRAHRELCVCDIAAVLDLTHSKASRHLRYLANRGLVAESRRRIWMYYRWNADATGDASAILRAVRPLLLDERFHPQRDRLRAWLERKAATGIDCETTPMPLSRRPSRPAKRNRSTAPRAIAAGEGRP